MSTTNKQQATTMSVAAVYSEDTANEYEGNNHQEWWNEDEDDWDEDDWYWDEQFNRFFYNTTICTRSQVPSTPGVKITMKRSRSS